MILESQSDNQTKFFALKVLEDAIRVEKEYFIII